MATVSRKLAPRHAKPAQRHFAKKGPKDGRDFDESSDEEQETIAVDANEEIDEQEIGAYSNEAEFLAPSRTIERNVKPLKVALGNVEVKDGRVIIDGQVESGKTIIEQREQFLYHWSSFRINWDFRRGGREQRKRGRRARG
jgi:microfibrillar-associated protein 1